MMLVTESPYRINARAEHQEHQAEIHAEARAGHDHSDRRRGLRIRQQRPIKVFLPAAARFVGGQTHDISATGLRLELPRSAPVAVGKLMNVHVGLDQSGVPLINRRQMLPARIVWVDRTDFKSPSLAVGVEFLAGIAARADAA